jgi:predicted RNA-binding protein
MCQATVYLGEQELARDVTWLEQTAEGVRFATFFDEPKTVRGRIRRIDFLKHLIVLEPVEVETDG